MKIKKFLSVIICLFLVCQLAMSDNNRIDLKERTGNWLTSSGSGYGGGTGGGLIGEEDASDDPAVQTPLRDAIPFVLLLSGIYGMACVRKQRRQNA
jgi:hypothetical protein